ncbi:MAG: acyltransferase, partial [Bacteroidia bacterium]|nr:acyltransferase [Bacteroidia bacterium]
MFKLRRVTSSEAYLPYIDGLRFYILSVVLIHFVDFYESHTFPIRTNELYQKLNIDFFFGLSSDNGILMFFGISGFILGMPFAKSILNNEPSPSLKSFYLRRLTRLEPPYLLILTGLFILNVFVIHRDTFSNTLPHFFASFFYLHNIIYEAH